MRLKLRFLAGGSIVFLLGLALGTARGFGPGYELLMGVGALFLVVGLFWKDKPPRQAESQGAPGT